MTLFVNPIVLRPLRRYALLSVRGSASKPPETVMLQEPILIVAQEDVVDLIGPPDSISNLRPILRARLINETPLQQYLREMQDETQKWNHAFWTTHNKNFIKERQEYIDSKQSENGERKQLNAEEMSEFYKTFLDKYWKMHLIYNFEWYKKNANLLLLALVAGLEGNLNKFR